VDRLVLGIAPKHLAGLPEEFSLYVLPDPRNAAQTSSIAQYPVYLQENQDTHNLVWEAKLAVDSDELLILSFFSPFEGDMKFSLFDANGKIVSLEQHWTQGEMPIGDSLTVPGSIYTFQNPQPGTWHFSINTNPHMSEEKLKAIPGPEVDGYLTIFNKSPYKAFAHFGSYELLTGKPITLEVQMYDMRNFNKTLSMFPKVTEDIITSAELVFNEPNGIQVVKAMEDDGLKMDKVSEDGIYSAEVMVKQEGQFSAQTIVRGIDPNGHYFVRTTQHYLSVLHDDLDLEGGARGVVDPTTGRMQISLLVETETADNLRAYAEVYAIGEDGNEIPVCWIGGLVNVERDDMGIPVIVLELDLRWLARAGATEPITLRNVVVQDVGTWIALETVDEIVVSSLGTVNLVLQTLNLPKNIPITEEMTMGIRPQNFTNEIHADANGKLLLLHGYCSDTNPWQPHPQDWTNPQYFLNPKATISHDAFAQKVVNWAKDFGGYSVVGHSQGGAVSVHILNYYWAGLDKVTGGRKVQTLGAPFQGCGMAGTAADFGRLFGAGCGRNDDLTRDGSALWLRGITTQTRNQVYYYTTTYQLGKLIGDYCNLGANIILDWPNDGVTELDYAYLSGANNQGNTLQQCHTGSMKYKAQYDDHTRNQLINALAAR